MYRIIDSFAVDVAPRPCGGYDVARLKDYPRSGTVVRELQRDDVGEVFHGEYRIIYRIEGQRILALTVRQD